MSKVAKTVRRVPVLIIGITILVTLFFGYALRNLEIEADLVKAIPSDLPEVQFFDQVNEEFPRQEFAIVGLIADDVFTAQTIAKLDLLTTEFEQVRGVGQVIGPTNVNLIRGTDEGVEISPILDGMPETPAEIDAFRATITTNPLYRNTFVSEDETAALILVQIDDGEDRDRILADIEDIVETHRTDGEAYRIAGETATLAAVRSLITSDLVLLSPLVVVVILLVLYLSFRTARGVILPVLTVVIGTVWTLGIMSLLRVPLSILTTVTPTILIAVGSAYGIHIINRFEIEIDDSASGEDPIGRTLRDTGLAVLMAGLTTVAGFLSFLSSRIEVIREFGLFAALGVACTLVFSLTFVPALLALMPAHSQPQTPAAVPTRPYAVP